MTKQIEAIIIYIVSFMGTGLILKAFGGDMGFLFEPVFIGALVVCSIGSVLD